jgi:hypothetical protein
MNDCHFRDITKWKKNTFVASRVFFVLAKFFQDGKKLILH